MTFPAVTSGLQPVATRPLVQPNRKLPRWHKTFLENHTTLERLEDELFNNNAVNANGAAQTPLATGRIVHAPNATLPLLRALCFWRDSLLTMGRRGIGSGQRRLVKLAPRLFVQAKKRLPRGGAIIAIVGGDGAGKSTVVDAAQHWLGKQFDVMPVHMGKPKWSWLTIVTRGLLGVGRRVRRADYRSFADVRYADATTPSFPGYTLLLRELCTARDRYHTYARARRYAAAGGLVVCDRFPLTQIQLMDGPQIPHLVPATKMTPLVRLLARWEARYYEQILPPDMLIVLRLDPAIAVERVIDRANKCGKSEDATAVRLRNQEIWATDWTDTPAHVIDASQSATQVVAELKSLVWLQPEIGDKRLE